MAEKSYFEMAAGSVRIKVVHVVDARADAVIESGEEAYFPRLVETLRLSREKSSTATYPREFEALNPVPTVAVIGLEEAEKFVELVKKQTGLSPYEKAVRVGYGGDVYIVALEHHCG